METNQRRQAGFTLLEAVVVGGVLLVCVAVALVLLRPANYEPEHRNAARRLDLAVIMLGVAAYEKVHGALPPSLTAAETPIGTSEQGGPTLCDDLVPTYLDDLFYDPLLGVKSVPDGACAHPEQYFMTGYTVQADAGRVILRAPGAERGETVTAERWFPLL